MSAGVQKVARPSSQPSGLLILHVEHVALAGRLLTIEIFEVPHTPASTPSSPVRPSSQSSSVSTSQTSGFRVAARDDVENEFSLFVTLQKAEYLYRAAFPIDAAASDVLTLEAMANGILAHLNIIGNRQRDVGKLTCREPEPRFEKKARVSPANLSPQKRKNPHITANHQDQRAVRVQKTSLRAMEAAAKAMHRSEADAVEDFFNAKVDRKSSEASLLHRMAVPDSNPIWKTGLETNYEENEPLVEENKLAVGIHAQWQESLSPVKRAMPERKTKHKGLEERRQKGRQQRIMAAQAAQEASLLQFSSMDDIEESDLEAPSRRSSMVDASSIERRVSQPRASSAPRSSAVVGNAYALQTLEDLEVSEPEQFLRRRTFETNRSVLKAGGWKDDSFAMMIEITDERPPFETAPSRVGVLTTGARRVMLVNTLHHTSEANPEVKQERKSLAPLQQVSLGGSASAPVLPTSQKVVDEKTTDITQIGSEESSADLVEERVENSPAKSVSIEPEANQLTPRAYEKTSAAELQPNGAADMEQNTVRSRSNSLGSVRLEPLPSSVAFSTSPAPENAVRAQLIPHDDLSVEKEESIAPPDPEIVVYSSAKDETQSTGILEDSANQEQADDEHGERNDNKSPAPLTFATTPADEPTFPQELTASQDGLPSTARKLVSPRQACWAEQLPSQSPELPKSHLDVLSPESEDSKCSMAEQKPNSDSVSATDSVQDEDEGPNLPPVHLQLGKLADEPAPTEAIAAVQEGLPLTARKVVTPHQTCWAEKLPSELPKNRLAEFPPEIENVVASEMQVEDTAQEILPTKNESSVETIQDPLSLTNCRSESDAVPHGVKANSITSKIADEESQESEAHKVGVKTIVRTTPLVLTSSMDELSLSMVIEYANVIDEKQEGARRESVSISEIDDYIPKQEVHEHRDHRDTTVPPPNLQMTLESVNTEHASQSGKISSKIHDPVDKTRSSYEKRGENVESEVLSPSAAALKPMNQAGHVGEKPSRGKKHEKQTTSSPIPELKRRNTSDNMNKEASRRMSSLEKTKISPATVTVAKPATKLRIEKSSNLPELSSDEVSRKNSARLSGALDLSGDNEVAAVLTAEKDTTHLDKFQIAADEEPTEQNAAAGIETPADTSNKSHNNKTLFGTDKRGKKIDSKGLPPRAKPKNQAGQVHEKDPRGKKLPKDKERSTSKEHASESSEHVEQVVESNNSNKLAESILAREENNSFEPQAIPCDVSAINTSQPEEIEKNATVPVQHSPEIQTEPGKSTTSPRRKSLSPVKRTRSAQTKAPAKAAATRKKSSAVQPTASSPIPELKRRNTSDDVNKEAFPQATRRMSSLEKAKVPPASAIVPKPTTKLRAEKRPSQSESSPDKEPKRNSSHLSGIPHTETTYRKKWGKWLAGRNIIDKLSCLQLEELVIQDPRNGDHLLKLGLRYARWPGSSLAGVLLLEQVALLHKNSTGTHEYWFWLGSAHLEIFMSHRKYLPIARFHLNKSLRAFTSAFAYIESLADPMLLLRYAIGLFWHKGDGNLEKTRDIFHELFSRFTNFCEKDRADLLFMQFQVFHRLKLFVDAIECMNEVVGLHDLPPQAEKTASSVLPSEGMQPIEAYDATDYRLMLMQCQQASGDYVAAAQTLTLILKRKSSQQNVALKDDEYFDLWCALAEKCFHHEDYALAVDYYATALNFAKQSQVMAVIHYKLGLSFQALGEDNKCVTEYKRARTANRHVVPLVSLTEVSVPYDDRFALLLQKPVAQLVEEVRVDLYGRAVKQLQRIFRQNRRDSPSADIDICSDIPATKMPSLASKRKSLVTLRKPSVLVKIEDIAEGVEAAVEEDSQQKDDVAEDNRCEDNSPEVIQRRHESFLARKQIAIEEMTELLSNPQYRGEVSPSSGMKIGSHVRSEILSPEKDRLDVRRKQSMEAFCQLGYVSSTMPWIQFWRQLLALASELFESRQSLNGSIARIRGRLPLVTDEVAFCALAESIGNVHQAAEKLHDSLYERELTYVCAVIDVSKQLASYFPSKSTEVRSIHVSLPAISSPNAGSMSPNKVLLSPARSSSKDQSTTKHLRVNQILNMHFQDHVQQQAAIAIAEANASQTPHKRNEKLMVLQSFRQTNGVLLGSQSPFGSEKAIS